jgi:hypothetical protein
MFVDKIYCTSDEKHGKDCLAGGISPMTTAQAFANIAFIKCSTAILGRTHGKACFREGEHKAY